MQILLIYMNKLIALKLYEQGGVEAIGKGEEAVDLIGEADEKEVDG